MLRRSQNNGGSAAIHHYTLLRRHTNHHLLVFFRDFRDRRLIERLRALAEKQSSDRRDGDQGRISRLGNVLNRRQHERHALILVVARFGSRSFAERILRGQSVGCPRIHARHRLRAIVLIFLGDGVDYGRILAEILFVQKRIQHFNSHFDGTDRIRPTTQTILQNGLDFVTFPTLHSLYHVEFVHVRHRLEFFATKAKRD